MSRARTAMGRRDSNEPEIISALERAGAKVWRVGPPAPFDILVVFQGALWLLEVKNPETARNSKQSREGLQESQVEFFATAHEQSLPARVVRYAGEALALLGITVPGDDLAPKESA